MAKTRVCVLTGYGINCDYESVHCFEVVGAEADRVHVNELISGVKSLEDYHIFFVPGGFSYGDNIASGKVLANKILTHLKDTLQAFIDEGKLVMGICNGFQVLVKMGILPGYSGMGEQDATITFNDSARFEDRWVYLEVEEGSPSIYTRGIDRLYLPIRHGEGKFFTSEPATLDRIEKDGLVAVRYTTMNGGEVEYPWNPNGSLNHIAGICDSTGRIFGMMPHPEAYNHRTNHPRWTREEVPDEGMGLTIFRNAVRFVEEELL
jgi:phosphoribosylformylglycinamidine synthase